MIMHLLYFCFKKLAVCLHIRFLSRTLKVSIVTKRDVIDRLGAEEVPHCQLREES